MDVVVINVFVMGLFWLHVLVDGAIAVVDFDLVGVVCCSSGCASWLYIKFWLHRCHGLSLVCSGSQSAYVMCMQSLPPLWILCELLWIVCEVLFAIECRRHVSSCGSICT